MIPPSPGTGGASELPGKRKEVGKQRQDSLHTSTLCSQGSGAPENISGNRTGPLQRKRVLGRHLFSSSSLHETLSKQALLENSSPEFLHHCQPSQNRASPSQCECTVPPSEWMSNKVQEGAFKPNRVISLQPYHISGGQLGCMCLLHWKMASNCEQQDGEEKQTAIRLLASLFGY